MTLLICTKSFQGGMRNHLRGGRMSDEVEIRSYLLGGRKTLTH